MQPLESGRSSRLLLRARRRLLPTHVRGECFLDIIAVRGAVRSYEGLKIRKVLSFLESQDNVEVLADSEASTSGSWLVTAGLAVVPLLLAGPALAYNKGEAEQVFKNVAGGAYVLLVCLFFFRLLRKRAKTGTTQASQACGAQ